MISDVPFVFCPQKMTSGELKEVYDLLSVGRLKFESSSVYHKMLETVLPQDKYTFLEMTLSLDILIAGDFLRTSKSRLGNKSAVWMLSIKRKKKKD